MAHLFDRTRNDRQETSEVVNWLKALRFSHNSGSTRRGIGRYHDRIVCTLAGLEAQRRYDRRCIRSHHAASDADIVADLLLRLHGEERESNFALKYLEARARNLVNHHWRTIVGLAKALLEYQSGDLSIDGYEVLVLEARDRIGGRIWTSRDLGVWRPTWEPPGIHGFEDNPISRLA